MADETAKPRRGVDSPWVPRILKVMSGGNVALYRATGGLLGGKWRIGSAFPWGVPVCLVTVMGRYRARVASPEERAELWPKLTAMYADFDSYQEHAGDRVIPVLVCEPEES